MTEYHWERGDNVGPLPRKEEQYWDPRGRGDDLGTPLEGIKTWKGIPPEKMVTVSVSVRKDAGAPPGRGLRPGSPQEGQSMPRSPKEVGKL